MIGNFNTDCCNTFNNMAQYVFGFVLFLTNLIDFMVYIIIGQTRGKPHLNQSPLASFSSHLSYAHTHRPWTKTWGGNNRKQTNSKKKKNPLPFWSHFGDKNEAICETQVLGHTQREMRRRWKGCHFFVPLSLRTETCREEGSSWQSIAPSDPYWAQFTHGRRVY